MHSDRRASHQTSGQMSDDDAEERDGDHNYQSAGTRDYAEELAQLQEKEIKHLRNLKNDKKMDDAERAAHIKDYKQVVTLQRFMILQELKTAVKMAKQKKKGASTNDKGERRAEFITYCTELVEDVPELSFEDMVLLVGKSKRYRSQLAAGFRAGGNGAGALAQATQRAWVHIGGEGEDELVLIVIRGEDDNGQVFMPPGQQAPDLLKELPNEVSASTSKPTTKAVLKGKAKEQVTPSAQGKGKGKAKAVGAGDGSEGGSEGGQEERGEEEGLEEEQEEKDAGEEENRAAEEKAAEEPQKPEKKVAKGKSTTKPAATSKVRSEQYLVYPTY